MTTITNAQINNLFSIVGNLSALEEVLQRAIDSKNSEQIQLVQRYLIVVKERLESTIKDIDR